MSFWDIIWFIIVSFFFIAYLMMLFNIIGDIFRDHEMSGVVKAIWLIALIFIPIVTALVYVIARGRSMADRQYESAKRAQASQDEYIKSVAGSSSSPTSEIAKAKAMLDEGVLNQSEFEAIKARALA
jgi:hypothetical protein